MASEGWLGDRHHKPCLITGLVSVLSSILRPFSDGNHLFLALLIFGFPQLCSTFQFWNETYLRGWGQVPRGLWQLTPGCFIFQGCLVCVCVSCEAQQTVIETNWWWISYCVRPGAVSFLWVTRKTWGSTLCFIHRKLKVKHSHQRAVYDLSAFGLLKKERLYLCCFSLHL